MMLGVFAMRKKPEPVPAGPPPTFERMDLALNPGKSIISQMRAHAAKLDHIETWVLAAKFADWMRDNGETGVFLPKQIDEAVDLFCEQKGYFRPAPRVVRDALHHTPGVKSVRKWRSDPICDTIRHLTDVQRPSLYLIERDVPKSRILGPLTDMTGHEANRGHSGTYVSRPGRDTNSLEYPKAKKRKRNSGVR